MAKRTKEEIFSEKMKKPNFPLAFRDHKPNQLFKVTTENGTVLVANDVAVEYAYNQYLEGAKKIKFLLPEDRAKALGKRNQDISFQSKHEKGRDKIIAEMERQKKLEQEGVIPKHDLQDESVPEFFDDGSIIPMARRMQMRRYIPEDE